MREISAVELDQTVGGNRQTFQSIATIGTIIASGSIYLAISGDFDLSFYTRATIGILGCGVASGLITLGFLAD